MAVPTTDPARLPVGDVTSCLNLYMEPGDGRDHKDGGPDGDSLCQIDPSPLMCALERNPLFNLAYCLLPQCALECPQGDDINICAVSCLRNSLGDFIGSKMSKNPTHGLVESPTQNKRAVPRKTLISIVPTVSNLRDDLSDARVPTMTHPYMRYDVEDARAKRRGGMDCLKMCYANCGGCHRCLKGC